MRYQILVLACWLWIATILKTEADECKSDFQCYMMMRDYNFECNFNNYEHISIYTDCEVTDGYMSWCNVSIVDRSCCFQCYPTWSDITTEIKATTSTPSECGCTPVSENTTSEVAPVIISDGCSTSNSSNSIIVVALGALVGLLLVLLVAVTAALAWTCWQLKKWKEMKCNAEYQLRSDTDHGQLVNPTYEGDDLLHLQQQQPVPAYETIPPHPRDGARLEFIEQGENGYHVLSREQRVNPETNTTSRRMETIPEDSREESYSKLELREESGSTKQANEEEYSKLETMNIGSNLPKDTSLDNDATIVSNDDSSEQTEGKRSVTDKKAFNDDGNVLQLENSEVEKKGQEEEAKGEQPLITITPDAQNNRKDSTNPETSTIDNA